MKINEDLKQWLTDIRDGKEVETVEMGGLSIGYENCIQHLAVCALTTLSEQEPPESTEEFSNQVKKVTDEWATKLDEQHRFSGAQVGAATNMVAVFWRNGVTGGLQKLRDSDPGRIIKMINCEVIALQKDSND